MRWRGWKCLLQRNIKDRYKLNKKSKHKEMQKVILRMIEKVPAWESKQARKGLTAAKRNDCT